MEEKTNIPVGGTPPIGRVSDAVSKWEAEACRAPATLSELRLDMNEKLVVPFTTSVGEARTHYLDYTALQGYVLCNGSGCLLCRIGRQVDTRDLLPLYDVLGKAVCVLAVSPNLRPQALKPQLMPVLRRVLANERVLVGVRKLDRQRYSVMALDLPADADISEEAVLQFQEAFDRGGVDLASIYQRLTNEEMAVIPEVATLMKLKGVAL